MQEELVVSETEYSRALDEIRRLVEREPDRGTPEGDRLEALASLVEAYESDLGLQDLEDAERR